MAGRAFVLVLMGPTGVGKSAVAMALAERLDGEIVSADSRQVYRGMDIGTAKPSPADRVRIPHHLIDILDPSERFSAGLFREKAQAAIADIQARGKPPIVVGGTSLYLKVLVGGYELSDVAPDAEYRATLPVQEAAEPGALHRRLSEVNPGRAAQLSPRDLPRIVRALELSRAAPPPDPRFPIPDPRFPTPDFRVFALTASRPFLYRRINERVDAMFAAGLVDEVRALLAKYPPDSPAFTSPGYREIIAYLSPPAAHGVGSSPSIPVGARRAVPISLQEAQALVKRNTRRFAKRQFTWLKQFDATPVDIEQLGIPGAEKFILDSLRKMGI